jgi:hypothetical protein
LGPAGFLLETVCVLFSLGGSLGGSPVLSGLDRLGLLFQLFGGRHKKGTLYYES